MYYGSSEYIMQCVDQLTYKIKNLFYECEENYPNLFSTQHSFFHVNSLISSAEFL